jgi:hypothetical protein
MTTEDRCLYKSMEDVDVVTQVSNVSGEGYCE